MEKKKGIEGSLTVEMSLLFPIIVFVIVSVLLFNLYICDIVGARAYLYQYSITNSCENMEIEEVKQELLQELEKQMLVAKISQIRIQEQQDEWSVSVKTLVDIGFLEIKKESTINYKMQTVDKRSFLVKSKVLIDTIEDVKGE